jgi:hypothetical protein
MAVSYGRNAMQWPSVAAAPFAADTGRGFSDLIVVDFEFVALSMGPPTLHMHL